MSESTDQVFANWSESAGFWDKHRVARRAMLDPLISVLRLHAGIPESPVSSSYGVLDIAAGPGDVSLALAESLGPKATIWCTDFVPEMVKIAERSALERNLHNIRFRECRAESLPLEDAAVDAVVCRFGIMFFSDPLQAIRDSLRVLKSGSRVAHCVWGTRQANAFHHVVQDVLDKYVPGPPADPDAPGAFRFAPSGKLVRVFEQAKARDIQEHSFRFNIAAPLNFEEFFETRCEMSDSLRTKLRSLPADRRSEFREDVRKNSERYFSSTGFSLPSEVLIVSARAA
jgi:ubiquinone/menaquinone biosynthesis C-methylase UbiE